MPAQTIPISAVTKINNPSMPAQKSGLSKRPSQVNKFQIAPSIIHPHVQV